MFFRYVPVRFMCLIVELCMLVEFVVPSIEFLSFWNTIYFMCFWCLNNYLNVVILF